MPMAEPEVQRKTLQVKIPKGMKEGQNIPSTGQGQSGINGGKNGDLYIEIHYKDLHGYGLKVPIFITM